MCESGPTLGGAPQALAEQDSRVAGAQPSRRSRSGVYGSTLQAKALQELLQVDVHWGCLPRARRGVAGPLIITQDRLRSRY